MLELQNLINILEKISSSYDMEVIQEKSKIQMNNGEYIMNIVLIFMEQL